MSYYSDHLAWQQRVNQEFKSQANNMDGNMYATGGSWFNYPDLINYLKNTNGGGSGIQTMARSFGDQRGFQGAIALSQSAKSIQDDSKSQFSYAGKSKLIYQSRQNKNQRSKTGGKTGAPRRFQTVLTPYGGAGDPETRSRLSKQAIQRFNEDVSYGPKSQTPSLKSALRSEKRSYVSRSNIMQKKTVEKKRNDDELSKILRSAPKIIDDNEEEDKEEDIDQVDDIPEPLESASQIKPSQSQISAMSGRTYISQLQSQLNEEREARQKLESELDELKQMSSEINSHLQSIAQHQRDKAAAEDGDA